MTEVNYDYTHLTDDEKLNGIGATKIPKRIRTSGYVSDFAESVAQLAELLIQALMNKGLDPDEALEWARQISKIDDKADQSFVDSQISAIVSGAPKGTFTDLIALQTAHPNGTDGVFLVLENGHWYYWNSTTTSWTDGGVYQATGSSEFPATNKVSNSKFSKGTVGWKASIGSIGSTSGEVYSLTTDGSTGEVRTVNQSIGFVPRKNEKVYFKMEINVETEGITKGNVNFHDWTATGAYHESRPIYTNTVNEWQTISDVVEITNDFTEQPRFYYSFSSPLIAGKKISMRKPTILNLTEIFGAGSEPTKEEVETALAKFGGSFEGTKSPFLNTKEIHKFLVAKTNEHNFPAVNLIENGNFKNTLFTGASNNWQTPNLSTINAKNNEVTFTASASAGQVTQRKDIIANHIYYFFGQIKASNTSVMLDAGGNSTIAKRHSGSGQYEFLSMLYSYPTNANIAFGVRDYNENGFTSISAKYFGLIDLTEVFGSGNEPSKVELDKIISQFENKWFDGSVDNLIPPKQIFKEIKAKTDNTLKLTPLEVRKSKPKVTSPKRLIMTITYDDECSSIYDLAYPIHQSENVEGTFYVIPSRIGTERVYNYGQADTWDRLRTMNNADVGRISIEHHTLSHMTLGNRTKEELVSQAMDGYKIFHENGIYPKHIAYPGGNHDYNALNVLQDYFETGVTTADLTNNYDLNPMRIHRYGMDNRDLATIKAHLDSVAANGEGWLVTYQHGLNETGISLGGYAVQTPANQLEIIRYAKSIGFEIVGLEEGIQTYAPHQYYMLPNSYDPSFSIRRNGTVYVRP